LITKQTVARVNELICTLCDNVHAAGNPTEQVEGIARLIESLSGSALDTLTPVVGFDTGVFRAQEENEEVQKIMDKISQGLEKSMKSSKGIHS
jgi:hypothetical protein